MGLEGAGGGGRAPPARRPGAPPRHGQRKHRDHRRAAGQAPGRDRARRHRLEGPLAEQRKQAEAELDAHQRDVAGEVRAPRGRPGRHRGSVLAVDAGDGGEHALEDYGDASALVVVWSCNHCPYVQAYEDRLKALARDFADRGVRLIAINSNSAESHPQDSFERMVGRAEGKGFTCD